MDHLISQRRRRITERGIAGAVRGCFQQDDYVVSNQAGAGFRADVNNQLLSIVSQNSGATAPATTYAYMFWADTTTGLLKQRNAANSGWVVVATLGQAIDKCCEGRLTLTSGTAVTTADVTAAETLYFTPYSGNKIALYNGTDWVMYVFTERSVDIPDVTSVHDVFIYDNAGTLTLEVLAWTNDTTRATALTLQDGIYVKTGATTRRYLGTFYSTTAGNGQVEDSLAKRNLWNYYNRVLRPMKVIEATDSWTYSTSTWRQSNGSSANQLEFVVGVSEDEVTALASSIGTNSTSSGKALRVGVGLDSTSAPTGLYGPLDASNAVSVSGRASYTGLPGIGRHYLAWLEYGGGADTQTWFGDAGGTSYQAGIMGEVRA